MRIVFIAIFMIISCFNAFAVKNLGTYGKTYEIKENNFYVWLMNEIKSHKNNIPNLDGENVVRMFEKQMEIKDFEIPKCTQNRTKTIDPTYILDHDIKDANGNVLYSKGTIVNPFDYITFKREYFFLDVDNSTHVKLYKKILESSKKLVQPLAVSGNLQKYYYDAAKIGINIPAAKPNNQIIEKMNITCVPSLAYQEGKMLKIEEFAITGENDEAN